MVRLRAQVVVRPVLRLRPRAKARSLILVKFDPNSLCQGGGRQKWRAGSYTVTRVSEMLGENKIAGRPVAQKPVSTEWPGVVSRQRRLGGDWLPGAPRILLTSGAQIIGK